MNYKMTVKNSVLTITDTDTGAEVDYALTPGNERQEKIEWKKTLDGHFAAGGTFGNFQW